MSNDTIRDAEEHEDRRAAEVTDRLPYEKPELTRHHDWDVTTGSLPSLPI